MAVNLFLLWLPIRNTYRFFFKDRDISRHGGWTVYRAIAFIVAFMLGIAGGACLIALLHWGLYLVTAAYLIFLVTVALNAWAIMLGVGQTEQAPKRTEARPKVRTR